MDFPDVRSRMIAAVGARTYRDVGDLTGLHPETVRRYLQGAVMPSTEFVSALCAALDINADWLLTGVGPMKASDVVPETLKHAAPHELLAAIAAAVDRLAARVDTLEARVSALETPVSRRSDAERTKSAEGRAPRKSPAPTRRKPRPGDRA